MTQPYTYRETGRRPAIWIMFAIGLVFSYVTFTDGNAPLFALIVLGIYMALVAYLLVANPVYGIILTDHSLTISPERNAREIVLSDIDHLEIRDWSDSTDYRLHLKSGETVDIVSNNLPTATRARAAFEARGVCVKAT